MIRSSTLITPVHTESIAASSKSILGPAATILMAPRFCALAAQISLPRGSAMRWSFFLSLLHGLVGAGALEVALIWWLPKHIALLWIQFT